jgi:hypothetical protein
MDDLMKRMSAIEVKAVTQSDGARLSIGRKLPSETRPDDPSRASRDRSVDEISTLLQAELAQAATRLERSLLDTAEGKAFKPGDLRNRLSKSTAWELFREEVAAAMEKAARMAASSAAMDSGYADAELDYDEIAKRVVYRKAGAGGIVKTLKRRLLAKLANELSPESTKADADKVIADYVSEWRSGQASTVALTESVHAYNEAMLDAIESTGATEVYVEDGDDHDEPCQAANGSVWPIDHARANRLEHPNCRRAFLPLPEVA